MIEGDWDALQEALAEIDERIAALQLALRRSEEDSLAIIQALEKRVSDIGVEFDNLSRALDDRMAGVEVHLMALRIAQEREVKVTAPALFTYRMDATRALNARVRDTFIPADRVATLEAYCVTKWNWKKDRKGMDAIMYVRSLADQGRLSLDELNSICMILGVRP